MRPYEDERLVPMSSGWFKQGLARLKPLQSSEATAPLPAEALATEMKLAKAAMSQGSFEDARLRLEGLARLNPQNAEILAHLGACWFLLGHAEEARPRLESAIHTDPENPLAYKFLVAALVTLGDNPDILRIAQKAIQLNPTDVELLSIAGSLHVRRGEFSEGAAYFNRAIEKKPDAVAPFEQLEILSRHSTWRRSLYEANPGVEESRRRVVNRLLAAHRRKGLDIDNLAALLILLEGSSESFPRALKIAAASTTFENMTPVLADRLASIFFIAGDRAQMSRFRELAFELDPADASHKLGLSHAWVGEGGQHWVPGWKMMTDCLHETRPEVHVREVPLWLGQKIGKRKVLVYQNQGIGDSIMGLRFAPMLAARNIRFDLWVLPTLADLAATVKGYETLIRTPERPDPRAHDCAYAVPLFGLIPALNLETSEIKNPPILHPNLENAGGLRARIAALPKVRIGLTYGGNPMRRDDWLRSIPTGLMNALASIKGVSWVNLMFDDRPDKERTLNTLQMTDPMPEVRSFSDTAAIIAELDAVVAVDSSVAHTAASLGKPVWVLTPTMLDWHWQVGSDTNAWWPTVRLLRSEAPGVWTRTMEQLATQIEQFVAEHSSHPDQTI